MKVAAKTDVGWVREHNEDSLHVDEHLALLIVADGIGGHKGVPLLHQAEMVGFICVDRELAEGSFLLEDVEFLGLLARLAMPQTSGETPGGHRVPHAREADEVLE